MKTLALICSIGALLGLNLNHTNNSFETKTLLKSNEIKSFDDFIYDSSELNSYYNGVTNLRGEDLILKLEEIISKNNTKPDYEGKPAMYSGGTNWSTYYLLDRDFDKNPLTSSEISKMDGSKIWWQYRNIYCEVLYETDSILFEGTGPNSGRPNGDYIVDREHIYPKSFGFNGSSSYYKKIMAGCDMHNLHMGERSANGTGHNALPYGDVTSNPQMITSNISNRELTKKGYRNGIEVFEPLDKEKGDIARSIFYMATRYHTYNADEKGKGGESIGESPRLLLGNAPKKISTTVTPSQTKTNDTVYGILDDFVKWNTNDKVSKHEKIRNTLCEKFVQGNRNPYIDFPAWVDVAFNPETPYVADPTAENGIRLYEKFELKNDSYFKTEYEKRETIDLSGCELYLEKEEVPVTINKNNLTFTLKNLDKNTEETYKSTDTISLDVSGNFSIEISYPDTNIKITKNFKVNKAKEAKFVGNIPTMYVGDTLTLSDYKMTHTNGGAIEESNYEYFLVKDDVEEKLETNKVLEKGTYNLLIRALVGKYEYEASSTAFTVSDLNDSVKVSTEIDEPIVGDILDLSKIKFSYIRNQKSVEVPTNDLTITLRKSDETDTVTLEENYTFVSKGYYVLKVSYTTPEEIKLEKTLEFRVRPYQGIFIGTPETYYEGDNVSFDKFEMTLKDNTPISKENYSFKLLDTNTDNLIDLTEDTKLAKGKYKILILSSVNGIEYEASSEEFEVKALQDSVTYSSSLTKVKLESKINLKSVEFTYTRNQQDVLVDTKDLVFDLYDENGEKVATLIEGETYKNEGKFTLKVSHKTSDNYELEASQELTIEKVPFWETKGFKIGVIAGGATLGAIILITVIVVIVKKH